MTGQAPVAARGFASTRHKDIFLADDTLQLGAMLDAFAQAITAGTPFKADGAMGRRDIRIVEAIYSSVAQGGKSVSIKS